MMSISISDIALPVSFPSQPSRSKAYTPLFLLPKFLGNPSRWITCMAFHPPSNAMIVYLWWFIIFWRWPFSHPARRASQRQILPRSSSNECGSIFGYHKTSSMIRTTGSSTHFGRVSGHYWTPSSINPLPSTLKLMAKQRSSIGWLCTSCTCITLRISVHGMRVFPMFNITTTGLSIAPPTIDPFRWGWDSNPWVPLMLHYLL